MLDLCSSELFVSLEDQVPIQARYPFKPLPTVQSQSSTAPGDGEKEAPGNP